MMLTMTMIMGDIMMMKLMMIHNVYHDDIDDDDDLDVHNGKLSTVECVGPEFETSGAEVLDCNPPRR